MLVLTPGRLILAADGQNIYVFWIFPFGLLLELKNGVVEPMVLLVLTTYLESGCCSVLCCRGGNLWLHLKNALMNTGHAKLQHRILTSMII